METPRENGAGTRLYWSHDGRVASTSRRGGGRYLINRWEGQWIIHYVPPPGVPAAGVPPVSVPWVGSRRSLPAAQQSCAQHARQLASEGGATSEQTPGREVREGGGSAARALDAGPTLYISTTPRTTWVWAEDIAAVKVVLGQEGSDWFTARRTGRSGTGSQIEFNAVDVEIGCVPAASGLDKLVAAGYRLRRHPECPQTTSPVWGAEVDCGPGVGPWEPPPLRGHQER